MGAFRFASRRILDDQQNQQNGNSTEDGRDSKSPMPRTHYSRRFGADNVAQTTMQIDRKEIYN